MRYLKGRPRSKATPELREQSRRQELTFGSQFLMEANTVSIEIASRADGDDDQPLSWYWALVYVLTCGKGPDRNLVLLVVVVLGAVLALAGLLTTIVLVHPELIPGSNGVTRTK